uniref:Ribulose-phosphate 3-epimerase n=1 Tax=uncultured marine group II/III euryarchaeote KM3_194_G04 TaxID=1457969 RepID=A0A075GSE1_9EURY|nr:ribulose-phosphate 3-epimerase (rpe, RPE) [uncultured marine group II/III euryarchaeote KM3_194_G04]
MLGADFGRLRELAELVAPHSGYLHMDVMDGHFVPNLTMGPDTVAALRGIAPLDVHLMVTDPLDFIEVFAEAGADIITVHAEANGIAAAIDAIHARGLKAGVAIRPSTPVSALDPWLDAAELLLPMSVEPGFCGQQFDEGTYDRVRALRTAAPDALIEVDGGVTRENAAALREAGADILVSGSAIFGADNPIAAARAIADLE